MRRLAAALLLALLAACGTEQAGQPDSGFSYLGSEPVGALCPDTFDLTSKTPWVPHPPTTETPDRLAPDADPVEAVVCRYTPEGQAEQGVDLTGGLDRIRHDLLLPVKLPGESRPCTLIGGRDVPHLLYLRYADGDLWISAVQEPNSCTDTGNGDVVSSVYLGDRLAASYDQGAWAPPPQPDGCSVRGAGRLGQERTLVPDGWQSLLVCPEAEQPEPRELDQNAAARVADLLNDLPAEADSSTCSGPSSAGYDLLFRYPDGPPVHVWWLRGCDPPLHNGSLQAIPSAAQSDELEALLAAP
jgi:hypothetical protein